MLYKFRILLEGEEPAVIRDVVIKGSSTLFELHSAILEAFEFDSHQMASFFLCDSKWNRSKEFTLMNMQFDDGSQTDNMQSTTLEDLNLKVTDKLLYIYDFMVLWTFYIQVIEQPSITLSKPFEITLRLGASVKQDSRKIQINPEDEALLLINRGKTADEIFSNLSDEDLNL